MNLKILKVVGTIVLLTLCHKVNLTYNPKLQEDFVRKYPLI